MHAYFRPAPLALALGLIASGCAMLPADGRIPADPRAAIDTSHLRITSAQHASRAAEHDAMFRHARQELIANRPRAAIEVLALLLEREPQHVEALSALGVAVAELDRLPEAISLLRRAVVLAPQAVHVRNNLGYALYRAGDLAQARAELRVALALQPDNTMALRNLALVGAAEPAAVAVARATEAAAVPVGPAEPVAASPSAATTTAAAAAAQASAPVAAAPAVPAPAPRAPARVVEAGAPARSPAAAPVAAASGPSPEVELAHAPAKAGAARGGPSRQRATGAAPHEPGAGKAAPVRRWNGSPRRSPRLLVRAEDGALRTPDPAVLRLLGLDREAVVVQAAPARPAQPRSADPARAPVRAAAERPVDAEREGLMRAGGLRMRPPASGVVRSAVQG